jgi:hypothetical protein
MSSELPFLLSDSGPGKAMEVELVKSVTSLDDFLQG